MDLRCGPRWLARLTLRTKKGPFHKANSMKFEWSCVVIIVILIFFAGLNDLHSPATSKVWRNHYYQSHFEQASQELRMVFPATTYSEGKAWKLMMEVFKISITTKHEAIRDVQLGVVKFVSHFICAQIFQMISALPLIRSVLNILDNFFGTKWTDINQN